MTEPAATSLAGPVTVDGSNQSINDQAAIAVCAFCGEPGDLQPLRTWWPPTNVERVRSVCRNAHKCQRAVRRRGPRRAAATVRALDGAE